MNSITRMILRGVVSGHVTLTPEVLGALKEVSQANSGVDESANSAAESANRTDESDSGNSSRNKRLIFINPIAGRWIRRVGCVLACALMLGTNPVRAGQYFGPFENANNAFTHGNYVEATRGYENIIAQQGWSAPVLFNLANAQQCAGQFGRAILNYERAALLAPHDPDIEMNLQRVRQAAGLETGSRSRIESVSQLLSLNGWVGFALVALFLLAAMQPLRQLQPRSQRLLSWGGVTAAFLMAVAAAAIVIRWPDLSRAVVTVPEAVAGVSPVTLAEPLFKLRAGEVVSWQQSHGDYALIENQAGHEGWVKAGEVARVIPSPRQTTVPAG